MKKIIFATVAAIAFLGFFFLDDAGRKLEPAVSKQSYNTVRVLRGDLKIKISATGIVEPYSKVEVKSKASGEILRFSFYEGDFIPKGKLLLRLDESDERRNVSKALADLQSASAKLKNAKTKLKIQKTKYTTDLKTTQSGLESSEVSLKEAREKLRRQLDLYRQKVASEEALDSAKTNFKIAQKSLVQAQAKLVVANDSKYEIHLRENDIQLANADLTRAEITLEEARERLEETEIYAPINGILIKKSVEVGQIISSGISNVSGGTALCLIADTSRLFIKADIDETDVGAIKIGQKVLITTDAFPNKIFQGEVRWIAPQGEIESNITIFKVKIEIIGNDKNLLKPMMTANVEIISRAISDTLYIAREAINKKGERYYVVLLKSGSPEEIEIKTGIQNPIHTQILSGLKVNDELVAGDWDKIKKREESELKKKSTLRKMLWFLRSK